MTDRVADVIVVPPAEHICGAEDSMRCIPCTAEWLCELINRAAAAKDGRP